jgi:hypothetical protein
MGKPIELDDIPDRGSGTHHSFLRSEIDTFLRHKDKPKAWELKEYENNNSARSTVSRINRLAEEEGLPVRALSRGLMVYLKRIKKRKDED